MTAKHIAFYIGKNGLETWEAKKINHLSQFFRSSVSLFNISQSRRVPLENPLKVLAMGNKAHEICLLVIEGMDAELAHFVLVGYITEHFKLFNADQEFNFTKYTQFDCYFQHFTSTSLPELNILEKQSFLEIVSTHIKADTSSHHINTLLLARESHVSTVMGTGIALPHIMTDKISIPSIILYTLPNPMLWHENHAPVHCIIAIAIPRPATHEMIYTMTNLTKKLVSEYHCQLLINSPVELQPTLLANMLSEVKSINQ